MEDHRSKQTALLEPRDEIVARNRPGDVSQGYDPRRGKRLLRRANVALAAGVIACNPAPGLVLWFFVSRWWGEWMSEHECGAECLPLCFLMAAIVWCLLSLWFGWLPYARARQDLTLMREGLMDRRGWEMTEEARVRARWGVWLAGVSGAVCASILLGGLALYVLLSWLYAP
jgi:hypothetical protein